MSQAAMMMDLPHQKGFEPAKEEPNAELKPQLVFASMEAQPHRDLRMRMLKTQETLQKIKNEPATFNHIKPEYYVNLSAFPHEFSNEDEALYTYNDKGIWHKIQFKFGYKKRTEQGFLVGFSLVCAKNVARPKLDQGQQIFDYGAMTCPVIVRFKWRRDKQKYIRQPRSVMHHTHKLEVRNCQNINNKNVQREIQMFVECNVPISQIHSLVNEKFAMSVSFEQIFHIALNIQATIRKETRSDLQQLISLLEEQKRRDPELKYAYEFEDGNPQSDVAQLIVQTSTMRRNYFLYHDVVFLDATYKTNANQLALSVFSGVNNEGRNIVLGFALVKRETLETYRWVLGNLKHFNAGVEPRVLLTDFDPSMSGAIEQTLKGTTHLLCQWHMQQNFKKHFIFLTKKKNLEAKILYKFIVFDQIYTPDPTRFQKIQDIIFQRKEVLGSDKLEYLRKMSLIKEKWASAYQPDIFIAGIHTISRAESVNSQIKARVHQKTTLVEIFHMMMELETRVIERLHGEQRNDSALTVNHPIMEEVYDLYTKHAFEHMLYQYMLSHLVKVMKAPKQPGRIYHGLIAGSFLVKDTLCRERFNVSVQEMGVEAQLLSSLYEVECNCKFFQNYRMLCGHIFAVFTLMQVKSVENVRPYERWTKRYQWENYSHNNLNILPLDLQVERKLAELEQKPLEQFSHAVPTTAATDEDQSLFEVSKDSSNGEMTQSTSSDTIFTGLSSALVGSSQGSKAIFSTCQNRGQNQGWVQSR